MATGPFHYAEAERYARMSAETFNGEPEFSRWLQGQAQVHATLALAAFKADPEGSDIGLLEVTR